MYVLDTVGLLHYQFNYFKFVIIILLCTHLQFHNFKDENTMTSVEHMEDLSSTSSTSSINSPQALPVVIPKSSCSSSLEADASPPRKKRSYKTVLPYYRHETSKTMVNDFHLLKLFYPYSVCILNSSPNMSKPK